MSKELTFAERLPPDTIAKLERAAFHRYETANLLRTHSPRLLASLYLYGYSAEMWLSAAYFRSTDFPQNTVLDRDIRQRRMSFARKQPYESGEMIMNGDPHPIVGWARFLDWQRSSGELSKVSKERLRTAIRQATKIYYYWRPELRYKVVNIGEDVLTNVYKAATWIKDNQPKLWSE